MVSYYGQTDMYRHQQQLSAPNGPFQAGTSMSGWYPAGYHPQGAQLTAAAPASYCMQEEQQMWHHHAAAATAHPHNLFQHDFQEFMHAGIPALQQHTQNAADPGNQLPSPPITVSGSDMSSPGAQSGTLSPHQNARPAPARSPYEWIKKTSYQSQPNPGKTRTKDKYRVVYTDHQRIELEKEFTFHNKYITIRRKTELANTLGLSERQIKIWFQNRRAKERKQDKKRVEEKTQNIVNYNPRQMQQMEMQPVLPNIVPQPPVMQRFMENLPMKLESGDSDQLG